MGDKNSISREELISKMEIGEVIQVNGQTSALKYWANIAGYNSGVLITSLPSPKKLDRGNVDYAELFPDNTSLVMRLIFDGVIYAFKSEVRGINLKACNLLMSSLPENIQIRKLRQGVRYPCVLQADFLLGETKFRGVLTNISEGGCLFRMKAAANAEAIRAMMDNDKATSLDVRFPFEDKDSSFEVKVKSIGDVSAVYLLLGLSYAEASQVADVVKKYLEFMQLEELSEYLVLT